VHGLLALMLLTEARRAARVDDQGRLVRLADQDRGRWDAAQIAEGQAIVRACLRRNLPGPYQVQAAIAAVHSEGVTDWAQVVALYDLLVAYTPTPVVAMNRAIAVAERDGPEPALALLDDLGPHLDGYHLFHAARGELLLRLGRAGAAATALDRALALTTNGAERELLQRQRARTAR